MVIENKTRRSGERVEDNQEIGRRRIEEDSRGFGRMKRAGRKEMNS